MTGRSAGRVWILLIVVGFVTAACGPTTVSGPDIPIQDPEMVTTGESLYWAKCAECHGDDLRGTDQGPSLLSIVYEANHHSDLAFAMAVRLGSPQHHWRFGAMEPVEGLGDEQIAAIIAFVRETQRIEGFEAYPPG